MEISKKYIFVYQLTMFLLKFNIEPHNFQCCLILKITLGITDFLQNITATNYLNVFCFVTKSQHTVNYFIIQ